MDGRLRAIWIGVNALGCVVIVVGGVVLELLASSMTRKLADDHQLPCSSQSSRSSVPAARGGSVAMAARLADPGLQRHQWMIPASVLALVVWLLAMTSGLSTFWRTAAMLSFKN